MPRELEVFTKGKLQACQSCPESQSDQKQMGPKPENGWTKRADVRQRLFTSNGMINQSYSPQ